MQRSVHARLARAQACVSDMCNSVGDVAATARAAARRRKNSFHTGLWSQTRVAGGRRIRGRSGRRRPDPAPCVAAEVHKATAQFRAFVPAAYFLDVPDARPQLQWSPMVMTPLPAGDEWSTASCGFDSQKARRAARKKQRREDRQRHRIAARAALRDARSRRRCVSNGLCPALAAVADPSAGEHRLSAPLRRLPRRIRKVRGAKTIRKSLMLFAVAAGEPLRRLGVP